ncbi:pentapeptide repeat-containing protein [Streptomyces sp. NPDC005349]|uniref:pentapeptide repeat-containing protein n=1 Tax=Streptomyces sp. NPDC005349 TaxID=3157037 RepID=UPI0033B924FF
MTGADLTGARLTEADLTEADLRGLDLYYANLTGTKLADATHMLRPPTGAFWNRETSWPPHIARIVDSRSTEVRPGVFQVRDDGMHYTDRVLTPVR